MDSLDLNITIMEAGMEHLPDLVPLFDGYRIFYRQQSDFVGARDFLKARIESNESIIYVAYIESDAIGFVQLFPIFSSVSMEPMYLLNDLFVEENYRGSGIGTALINAAKDLCRAQGMKGLALQTEVDNPAQKLYEALDFKKDPDLHYFWTNEDRNA